VAGELRERLATLLGTTSEGDAFSARGSCDAERLVDDDGSTCWLLVVHGRGQVLSGAAFPLRSSAQIGFVKEFCWRARLPDELSDQLRD
jgi:hypothetical protein